MRSSVGTQEAALCPLPGPLGFFPDSPNFKKNMQVKRRHTCTQTQAELKWDHSVLKPQCVCICVCLCVCVCVCVSVFAWSYKSFYFVSEHFIPNSSSWTFCLHFIPLQCHTQHSRAALSSAASLCSKKIPSIIISASGKVNCKAHSSNSSSLLRPNVCLLELSAFGWKTKPLLRSI